MVCSKPWLFAPRTLKNWRTPAYTNVDRVSKKASVTWFGLLLLISYFVLSSMSNSWTRLCECWAACEYTNPLTFWQLASVFAVPLRSCYSSLNNYWLTILSFCPLLGCFFSRIVKLQGRSLRIISLNGLLFSLRNALSNTDIEDPVGQLAWLRNQLEQTHQQNHKVSPIVFAVTLPYFIILRKSAYYKMLVNCIYKFHSTRDWMGWL